MRGLSGWFNQVSTDGIKKKRQASKNKDVAAGVVGTEVGRADLKGLLAICPFIMR
jgi:hypothetical protein